MIKSMTGFGRFEILENDKKLCVEIKSVNHRYLDINVRMPKKFIAFESDVREIIKQYAKRGKFDVFFNYEELAGESVTVKYNKQLALQYMAILSQMREDYDLVNELSASRLAAFPEVITTEEHPIDEEEIRELIQNTVSGSMKVLEGTRAEEGGRLEADMILKLDQMDENVKYISGRCPEIMRDYQERLKEKVEQLLENANVDESRIVLEVTLLADKVGIDEELVRLGSHIISMREALENGMDIGRKLDFLAQEMNREANTILSKINDVNITNRAIELKTDIEKIREQVQNIE